MNFKLELPEGVVLIERSELKALLEEMLLEIQGNQGEEEVMTIREAAEYLKVSVPTIRNMIAKKEIPFFQRGQVIRLNRRDVKEWLRNNSNQ
ncbi:helix-turn-helix domain-containing protein [Peribacillus frigoritolerans]|uniref:helix-turn-helix domain-containing protein n=1 Tax=Peribacillus frigoritolerans TaxID=450367 RepID=UPI0038088325